MAFHCIKLDRGGGRTLHLYSTEKRDYRQFEGLPPVSSSDAHLRWHPLRREWIGHAAGRQGRTFLPQAADCPLCAMTEADKPSDIPVDDYEIAIFTNRFSALSEQAGLPPELDIATQPGIGLCEVVSYSAEHGASLSTIGPERISLLLAAIGDRITDIYQHPDIEMVLPFENRGREIGVTLDHPHGQIYALSHLPEQMRIQADAMAEDMPLANLSAQLDSALLIAENDSGIAYCPRWARYPFEVWVMPHRQMDGPQDLTDSERADMADLMAEVARRLDAVFDGPMPYTLAWHVAPKGYQGRHHFYLAFQPLKRGQNKQKYLASVEQITGFFLVDLPPEKAAAILRGEEKADA